MHIARKCSVNVRLDVTYLYGIYLVSWLDCVFYHKTYNKKKLLNHFALRWLVIIRQFIKGNAFNKLTTPLICYMECNIRLSSVFFSFQFLFFFVDKSWFITHISHAIVCDNIISWFSFLFFFRWLPFSQKKESKWMFLY